MRPTSADNRRETDALSLPLEFELEQSGSRTRMVLGALLFFVIVCGALLAFAPIRAVVVAAGAVKPLGEAVAVHHEFGGSVEAVLVERGAVVEKNQPLLRLRSAPIESEIKELEVRRAQFSLRIERLEALLKGRPPDFDEVPGAPTTAAIDNEKRQYHAARAALEAEFATFEAQRATRQASIQAQREEAAALRPALAALDERFDMLNELVARGAIAKPELYALATQRSEAKSRYASVIGQSAASMREMEEIDRRRASMLATKRAEWSAELTEAVAGGAEIEEQLRRRRDVLERTVVRAPMAGAVQMLGAAELGAVLPAGALAAEIVPLDRPLVARVRVSPDEIGHVKLGDEALLRITTYDLLIFGEMDGRITRISPTAFQAQDGATYYEVDLAFQSRFEDGTDIKALAPGMSLSANLLGEKSSVLAYLFTPFKRALDLAFTSR